MPSDLMRSRYSAFVTANSAYLAFSHHESTLAQQNYESIAVENPNWTRLEVIDEVVKGSQGWVEFKAFYQAGGAEQMLHERSRFIRQKGLWKYVDGELYDH